MGDSIFNLNAAERGLLFTMANTILLDGPVADDLTIILRRTGLEADREMLEPSWPKIREFFVPAPTDAKKLTYPPIQAAIDESKELIRKKAEGGRIGGLKTQGKKETLKDTLKVAPTKLQHTNTQHLHLQGPREEVVSPALAECFARIAKRYPNQVGIEDARETWMDAVKRGDITEELIPTIEAGFERYLDSELWERDFGKYIHTLKNFIWRKLWNDQPKASVASFLKKLKAV